VPVVLTLPEGLDDAAHDPPEGVPTLVISADFEAPFARVAHAPTLDAVPSIVAQSASV
jgi:hypothetical protein